jgi:ribosomal protein S18 acetylase RimI-like enzyme
MVVTDMIRPVRPHDTPALVAIAEGTGIFKPAEIVALREVLDDYHREAHARGHHASAFERDGGPIGFVYFAPASMTDRTWYLYWIAVDKQVQARGTGGALLRHAEDQIRQQRGRLLLVETSSLPHYELTRKFYSRQGYEVNAVVSDFYSDGDDLVIFRKRLAE